MVVGPRFEGQNVAQTAKMKFGAHFEAKNVAQTSDLSRAVAFFELLFAEYAN